MMRFPLTQPDAATAARLRRTHLLGLAAGQEFFLETQVAASQLLMIEGPWPTPGYLAVHGTTLTEWHLPPEAQPQARALWRTLRAELKLGSALCQSFDAPLLQLLLLEPRQLTPVAWLFRDRTPTELPALEFRPATQADRELIETLADDFFTSDEYEQLLPHKGLWLAFSQRQQPVGCGLIQPLGPLLADGPARDVGMVVAPDQRQRGYGAAIVAGMAHYCRQQGWEPQAGCALDNTGSRLALEKAGFWSRHLLLRAAF